MPYKLKKISDDKVVGTYKTKEAAWRARDRMYKKGYKGKLWIQTPKGNTLGFSYVKSRKTGRRRLVLK